jgi:hypothetical protein
MRCGHSGGYGWWGCKGRRQDGRADCPPAIGVPEHPLSDEARQAVLAALDDEYRALAFYRAVLGKFPYAQPFLDIVDSEARHAAALIGILDAYGAPAPANAYLDSAEILASAPDTLAEACEVAVRAEIRNDRLYAEQLLAKVAAYPVIAEIFATLMRTSRQCHLLAFRTFAEAYRMERPLAQSPEWDCGAACAR